MKRLRPLEKYSEYNSVLEPVIDLKYLKENLKEVPHKMAIQQVLDTSSSCNSSQENDANVANLKPEEIIANELKV